mmetsp:Transcript_85951/g.135708  ORF Transcript_85951/g.135708 Transcript_85951/m.135708 type:complete len:144 (+) Transcript_85951:77-508(+)
MCAFIDELVDVFGDDFESPGSLHPYSSEASCEVANDSPQHKVAIQPTIDSSQDKIEGPLTEAIVDDTSPSDQYDVLPEQAPNVNIAKLNAPAWQRRYADPKSVFEANPWLDDILFSEAFHDIEVSFLKNNLTTQSSYFRVLGV